MSKMLSDPGAEQLYHELSGDFGEPAAARDVS